MGMDSKKLSGRTRQPGHDQSFRASETNFAVAVRSVLNPALFDVIEKPKDLLKMLPSAGLAGAREAYGVQPELAIVCKATGRKLFFEVKKQGPAGNADERAAKHHTVQFQKRLKEFTGYSYHSFVTIFCDELATLPKYVAKHAHFFEPNAYFCWCNYKDTSSLASFLDRKLRATIVDDAAASVLQISIAKSGATR